MSLKKAFRKFKIKSGLLFEHGILNGMYWLLIAPIQNRFDYYKERISRSFAYAKHGWSSVDFDSISLFSDMRFKLERIAKCIDLNLAAQYSQEVIDECKKNGFDIYWQKRKLAHDAIYEALALLQNLENDDYDYQARKLGLKYDVDNKLKNADLDRLNVILKDYSGFWWD